MGARFRYEAFSICLLFLHKAIAAAGMCITLNGPSTEFTISCDPTPEQDLVIVIHNVTHGYMDGSSTCASQDEFHCGQVDYQDDLYWSCSGKRTCTGVITPQSLTNCYLTKSTITHDSTHVYLDFGCVPRSDIVSICNTDSLSQNGEIYIQSPSFSSQTGVRRTPELQTQNNPGPLDPVLSSIQICRCQISGPVYTQIELRTMNFDLAPGEPECQDEHLIIGNPANNAPSGKLCGNKYDQLWKATGNLMELEYFVRTDIGDTRGGFLLEARAEGFPGNARLKVSCAPSQLTTTPIIDTSLPGDSSSVPSTSVSTNITSTSSTANQSEAPVAAIVGGVVAGIVVVAVVIAVIAFVMFRRKKSNVYEEPEKSNPIPRNTEPAMKDNLAYVPTDMSSNPCSPSRKKNDGVDEEHIYEDIPIPPPRPFKDGKPELNTNYVNEKSQHIVAPSNVSNNNSEEPVPRRIVKGRVNAFSWPPTQDSVKEAPVYLSLIGD